MRTIDVQEITNSIKEMCIEANHFLPQDMDGVLKCAAEEEKAPLGRQILAQLQENLQIAGEDMIPICQDTGMAVIFLEIGQEVHFEGGLLEDADTVRQFAVRIKGKLLLRQHICLGFFFRLTYLSSFLRASDNAL